MYCEDRHLKADTNHPVSVHVAHVRAGDLAALPGQLQVQVPTPLGLHLDVVAHAGAHARCVPGAVAVARPAEPHLGVKWAVRRVVKLHHQIPRGSVGPFPPTFGHSKGGR